GATSEGEWHEAMNFSAIHGVPVIWLCENNQWAISTPISKQMRNTTVADRAAAYGMEGVSLDGFDPIAVYMAVRTAREKAVAGDGPTLIEAKCYRFLSHTTDDDDRTYRTRDEVEKQRSLDPVPRFEQYLIDHDVLARDAIEKLRGEIAQHVNDMTDRIEAEPLPNPSTLYTQVYAGSTEPWI
ncbi:MAG: thiamine pyrophosphate-dependent dehydrogenase E1 component subunit alpha, partial [Vulcanimicrobiaceae bacterium]